MRKAIWRKKRTWLALSGLGLLLLLNSCTATRVLMQTAPSSPNGPAASPPINISSKDEWIAKRPDILAQFEKYVYGQIPNSISIQQTSAADIDGLHFDGSSVLSTRQYSVLNNGQDTGREFGIVIARPANMNGPVPLIIMQNFCPNNDVIPNPDVPVPDDITFSCSGDGMMSGVFTYMFGRYIVTPPIADIMNRGYAIAAMYPSEFVPDSKERGAPVLNTLFAEQDPKTRTGAIAAWAKQFSLVSRELKASPEFSSHIAFGHSRFGKTALLAAAMDPQIDGVISHQSGTGGASLSKEKNGETVKDITETYPYWFNGTYAAFAGHENDLPIDQHDLLALIAPRPVLLGNSKRDVWSDPNGAFRSAQGATPVYKLFGSEGLTERKLTGFAPDDDISFWMRPGTHGIVKEDWPAFLDFLDAHFK